MEASDLKKFHSYIIVGLIAIFAGFALWLRLVPMFNMGSTDVLTMVASDDPLYNLRQTEQLLANSLTYAWFDPMTLYPFGSNMYWGPLFPIIIALCCIITGATTRPEIISIALLVGPLLGTLTVILMYYVGKTCGDWKTGLLACGFTAIVSGQFFYRSFYGYIDHHIAEVLFSTLFCLFYMYALLSEKSQKTDLKDVTTYKRTLLFSCLAGVAYILGLYVMPTIILFAMIAGIFTVIHFIIDVYRGRTSEYILVINTTVFVIAIAGLLLFGLKNEGMNLSAYTIGHIYAYIGMIAGTALLYILQIRLSGKAKYFYPASLAGCGILFALVLYITSPQLYTLLVYNFFSFFGQAAVTNTVQEARGWSTETAWMTFNYSLLLMIGGILVMLYKNTRDEHPEQVFALVWSLIMLASTIQHVRYEYYLAINITLLSAVCVSFTIEQVLPDIRKWWGRSAVAASGNQRDDSSVDSTGGTGKKKKGHKKAASAGPQFNVIALGIAVIIIGTALLFVYTSVSYSYTNASSSPNLMNPDWRETLEWMEKNTPDPGVDYLAIHDRDTFEYPKQAYGVMSWWDYGHLITYVAKRIPNANPFQQGVAGDLGAAAYFLASDEDTANNILDTLGTRYIITDIEMDSGKFWAMATWADPVAGVSPYQKTLLVPTDTAATNYQTAMLNTGDYFLTTVSRLHNFDGSMTEPSSVYYVEYADPRVTKVTLPVMASAVPMNATQAALAVEAFNQSAPDGYHAEVFSASIVNPTTKVPALRHYRLVHESPTDVFNSDEYDVRYVKTFEYVKGARIKGDGIIEVPIITNTGRNFIYRQESVNGEFVVPYSTTGNPYDVRATGKYTIAGTNKQFDVPEIAVMQGLDVQ